MNGWRRFVDNCVENFGSRHMDFTFWPPSPVGSSHNSRKASMNTFIRRHNARLITCAIYLLLMLMATVITLGWV
jgi:hypothetical protein